MKLKNLIKEVHPYKNMKFYDSFYFKPGDSNFKYWTVTGGPFEGRHGQYYEIKSSDGDKSTVDPYRLETLKRQGYIKSKTTGAWKIYK